MVGNDGNQQCDEFLLLRLLKKLMRIINEREMVNRPAVSTDGTVKAERITPRLSTSSKRLPGVGLGKGKRLGSAAQSKGMNSGNKRDHQNTRVWYRTYEEESEA